MRRAPLHSGRNPYISGANNQPRGERSSSDRPAVGFQNLGSVHEMISSQGKRSGAHVFIIRTFKRALFSPTSNKMHNFKCVAIWRSQIWPRRRSRDRFPDCVRPRPAGIESRTRQFTSLGNRSIPSGTRRCSPLTLIWKDCRTQVINAMGR